MHLMLRGVCNRAQLSPRTLASGAGLVGLVMLAVGCATPVGVTQLGLQAGYRVQTESAISAGEPSEPSKTVLRRLGLLDRFEEQPKAVLAELHRGLSPTGDEDRLFALAELSFLHAERTGDRAYFLASAVYAWALLFRSEAAGPQLQRSDPRLRLAYDFYNQGVAQGLAKPTENTPRSTIDDGVVAYKSAHIDEAVSELVVQPSGHSVQGTPQAIEEIRRILLEHAATPTESR